MPISFNIIRDKDLLYSEFSGVITNFELLSSYEKVMVSKDFSGINCEIVDLRNTEMAEISSDAMRSLSSRRHAIEGNKSYAKPFYNLTT